MRKLLLGLLFALAAIPAGADVVSTSHWGIGFYAADPFTCNTLTRSSTYYHTGSNVFYYCNGTSWTLITTGASGLAGSGTLNTIAKFTPDGTTVGDSTITDNGTLVTVNTATKFLSVPIGDATTSNFLNITGTLPTVLTASAYAANFQITTAGSSSQLIRGINLALIAGYTGSSGNIGIAADNAVAGTGGNLSLGGAAPIGNMGLQGSSLATTTGSNFGVLGLSGGGDYSAGLVGRATVAKDSATNIGVIGAARNTGASAINVGVSALLSAANGLPVQISAALLANNAGVAAPIFIARDNTAILPVTGATATWSVIDGAIPQYGLGVLTSATMTAETQAYQTTSTSSYTWTNAQVVALGANVAGDITVATLPAKTQVLDAMVVITGAAAGPATVTVSCGDAVGATPFINYVVPSDAKAAANTVYGDAVAERGTSLDAEFWYLPSYTGTTLVTCHFIGAANLDTVTGSTGRVILATRLLP